MGVSVTASSGTEGGSSGSVSLKALVSFITELFSKVSITGTSVGVVGEVALRVSSVGVTEDVGVVDSVADGEVASLD